MKKKKRISAAELMAQLQQDPEFLALQEIKQMERTRQEAEFKELERPILEELQRIGVVVSSLSELPSRYAPISAEVVQILLRWIPVVTDEKIQEWLVRVLASTKVPFDGAPLIDLFEKTKSDNLRWVIANTLSLTHPTGVTEWVLKAAINPSLGKSREMLALAVAQLAPKEIANATLVAIFDEFPGHVAEGLSKIGEKRELEFLETHLEDSKGWVKKAIEKAIRSINKRLTDNPRRNN